MIPQFIPKHFKIEELVSLPVFTDMGQSAFSLFDTRILITIDNIREYFGVPVIVNDWSTGGKFSLRGFRNDTDSVGAKYSQHRYGRAIDFDVKDMSADSVRKTILDNQNDERFQFINAMETGIDWVHIDCRNVYNAENGIVLFNH
jgi:hypothetical protein